MAIISQQHSLTEIPELVYSELRSGVVQKKHPFRNVVLGTIGEVYPETRWVVLRKVLDDFSFLIFTDTRSSKLNHIGQNNHCTLLFFHNKQGLQIRFEVTAQLHHQNALTQKYWPGIQGGALRNYTTSLAPGTIVDDIEEANQFIDTQTDEFFSILELSPSRFEILQLSREKQIRAEFKLKANRWEGSFLVP